MSYSFLLMFICIEKFQYTNCWFKSKTKNPPNFSSIEVIENISGLIWLFFFFPISAKLTLDQGLNKNVSRSWNRSQFRMELLWKLLLCVIALALKRKVTIPPYMILIWAIVTKLAAKPLWKEHYMQCHYLMLSLLHPFQWNHCVFIFPLCWMIADTKGTQSWQCIQITPIIGCSAVMPTVSKNLTGFRQL